MKPEKSIIQAVLPLAIGAAAFFTVAGPRVLYPTNLAWIGHLACLGLVDPAQHYLGWLFFRHADWSFPLGLNPDCGLELGSAILFSDSNPLLAFIFKLFGRWLPEPFQYFGIWLLACFVLQAWFGWKLAGRITDRPGIRALASGLFAFSPPMIWRLKGHMNLAAHFLVLAALYLVLERKPRWRRTAWGVLLVVAAWVHSYLLAMVGILWVADLAGRTINRSLPPGKALCEWVLLTAIVSAACWQAGYFSVGPGTITGGFGFYRFNLLSLFDSSGWSYVLHDIPEAGGDYEGFNFLGLGVLLLLAACLPALIGGRTGILDRIRRFPMLAAALAGLTLFALSYKIGVGPYEFHCGLPDSWVYPANVFRSSGRMFWPVFYAIVLGVVFVTVRCHPPRTAAVLLVAALLIQVADTSAAWTGIRRNLMPAPATAWATPLEDSFWEAAALRYRKVRWIPPQNFSPHWLALSTYAAKHRMGTDAVYLARVGSRKLAAAQAAALRAVETGRYASDTFYVLDDGVTLGAAINLDAGADVLAHVDGFNVLAPGWGNCAGCPPLADRLEAADLLPVMKVGDRIPFNQGSPAVACLNTGGWSHPEPWGTWSEGRAAEIILPAAQPIHHVRIEALALLGASHPSQEVVIEAGGKVVYAGNLTRFRGNIIEFAIPEAVQEESLALGWMRLRLRFKDAIRPVDLGINTDNRILALGLEAITLF